MKLGRFGRSEVAQNFTVRIDYASNPEMQAVFDNAKNEDKIKNSQFRDYVDSSPNLNAEFAQEIELTEGWFARHGITVAPASILSPDRFKTALDIIGAFRDQSGSYQAGRTIVRGELESNADHILSNLLHEGAHSEVAEHEPFVVSRKRADKKDKPSNWRHTLVKEFGFSTYRIDDAGNIAIGDFLEEAYADLTRVYGLRDLGRTAVFYGHDQDYPDLGVKYVRHEYAHAVERFDDERWTTLPGDFMIFHSETQRAHSMSTLGAYALELMDVATGLYGVMARSRRPVQLDDIKDRIESIRPGLYADLSQLKSNDQDYKRGLQMVKAAVR